MLNGKDHTAVVLGEETINADAMISLFRALEATYPLAEKIHCIADNARYNHYYETYVQCKTTSLDFFRDMSRYSKE